MTPISALAILFCIYAVSELIAQKSKAIFSTVLSIAILLLAGFWSGILPRTLIDDAQITESSDKTENPSGTTRTGWSRRDFLLSAFTAR